MFEIELKFYHKEWKNYFHKQFNEKEALDLFSKLIIAFSNSEWRLVYKPIEEKE